MSRSSSRESSRAEKRNRVATVAPFLRWAGSKKRLLPRLTAFWREDYARYVEPFAGSACLLFALCPEEAILSDINEGLVQTLIEVRDGPAEVSEHLSRFPVSRRFYYRLRGINPSELSAPQVAARFIYLNRFCFNGLYRTNLQGQFNVPFAPAGTGRIPQPATLMACSRVLKHAKIAACDFMETISEVREGDFVYLDPPFAVRTRRIFREYHPAAFGPEDVQRFGESLQLIDNVGAAFVASYADCALARRVFHRWHTKRVRTRRCIAGFSKDRRHAYELIATNIRVPTSSQRG